MSEQLFNSQITTVESGPLITVVIVCNGNREQAVSCLRALQQQRELYPHSELILVDHGSQDNIRQTVMDSFPGVRIISTPASLSCTKAGALGMVMANGAIIAVVNCSSPVIPGLFRRLADAYLDAVTPETQQLFMSMAA